MKRKLAAAVLGILLPSGCAAPEDAKEEPVMTTEPVAVQTADSEYDAMVERSLLNIGNPYRLQQKIRAAQSGM